MLFFSCQINTNGVISFLGEVSQYRPDLFPLADNRPLIAPFWADVDTSNGGVIYYRETQDIGIRTRASEEIEKYFVRQSRFSAKWVMVVTWLDVAGYGGNSNASLTVRYRINSLLIFLGYLDTVTENFQSLPTMQYK
jgi:hypothetical protein